MKTLTISIAAYNVEDYLGDTLESFCIPEVMDDIEVLVVDDGSKDNTHQIAEKYQEKYPNTFRYIPKENGGHGSTVNKGIELASGKYFKVVDGDDWVQKTDFVQLVEYLRTAETDLVLTDFSRVYTDGSKKKELYFSEFEVGKVYPVLDMPEIESIAMHSIAVRSQLLKNNGVRLSEKCFYVDIEYVVYILNHAESAVYMPYDVYMYRYGTPNQSVNVKNMIKNIGMRIKVSSGLAEYVTIYKKSAEFNPKRYELMKKKVVRMISGTCLVYLAYDDTKIAKKELKAYEETIKSISKELFDESGNEKKVRIMRFMNHVLFPIENKMYHLLKM